MTGKTAFPRRCLRLNLVCLLLLDPLSSSAAPPLWWSQEGPDGNKVVDPAATNADPKSVANIGQAKYMAYRALSALEVGNQDVADAIRDELVLPQPNPSSPGGTPLPPILSFAAPAPSSALAQAQYAPLLIGQLKAIAAPFYKHLDVENHLWLEFQLNKNQTKDPVNAANMFPWTSAPGDDQNKAIATTGQLKAVFSLRFESLNLDPGEDEDGDGLTNGDEAGFGTDPLDPWDGPQLDCDGDGVPNTTEIANGTNPVDAGDFPVVFIEIHKVADGESTKLPAGHPSAYNSFVKWYAQWTDDFSGSASDSGPATPTYFSSLIQPIPFPTEPPTTRTTITLAEFGLSVGSACHSSPDGIYLYGTCKSGRIWLKAPASPSIRKFSFLKITKKSSLPDVGPPFQTFVNAELVDLTIPANQTLSNSVDLEPVPAIEAGKKVILFHELVPMGVAPEVLAVNSDFDEGRIDSATGYAIPDCDDIPGVDQKTGSGNTQIALNASRAHLDGLFTNDEKVTDDMYKGWFGAHPILHGDYFWDGANVTIRKINKIDNETGYKESGQVRFYAKWSGGYYGISPYDFQTLQPVNLVSAGVNLRPGEGVYGASSSIPAEAEFYMEGVRPGKITLEWRLQKGSIDVKHEQTFNVETRMARDQWREEVVYQIRLQTKVATGTSVDLRTYDPNLGFYGDLGDQTPKVRAIYYYYRQLFQQMPEKFMWAGMAKVAAAPIYAGMSDLTEWYYGSEITPGTGFGIRDPGTRSFINNLLLSGQQRIFRDMAWSHRAYQASGIWAIEHVIENEGDVTDLAAWKQIDKGIQENLQSEINKGNKELLIREQRDVVQTDYSAISTVFLRQPPSFLTWWVNGVTVPVNSAGLANAGEWLSANANKNPLNPQLPNGPKFRATVPSGRLDLYADRWAWTSNPATGMLEMWTGESTGGANFDAAKRMSNNNLSMRQAASVYTNSNRSTLPND